MSAIDYIPGMKAGATARNILVGFAYLLFIPIVIFLVPFIVAYHVARNTNEMADGLTAIPGISQGGGAVSGIAAFLYVVILLAVVGAALPGGGQSGGGAPEAGAGGTPTQTVADGGQPTDGDSGGEQETQPVESTPTPSPEPTPTPTRTPTQTPTATPSPTPAPDEKSYQFSGSGSDVTDSFATAGGLVVIDLEHTGSSNFIVRIISEDGDEEKYLVNAIGTYDGRVAFYLPADTWLLDIDADGSWTANVKQPRYSSAEIKSLPASKSGEHHDYMGPFQFEGTTEITIRSTSDDHVAVWLARHDGQKVELLENDVGPYESTTVITQEGIGLIIIDSDSGEWVVEIGG